jgi:hypothetical protein
MNRPTSVLVGRSMSTRTQKARSRAEGGTKERHSYKPLRKEFRRAGFNYRQIAREGNVAVYEQHWTGCAEPSVCYEVIRIRRRDGFQISEKFIEPYEVYPNSDAWGVDGFSVTDRNKAWDNFFEISARRRREVK